LPNEPGKEAAIDYGKGISTPSAYTTILPISLLMGIPFGFALEKGRVFEPQLIVDQMLMQKFQVLLTPFCFYLISTTDDENVFIGRYLIVDHFKQTHLPIENFHISSSCYIYRSDDNPHGFYGNRKILQLLSSVYLPRSTRLAFRCVGGILARRRDVGSRCLSGHGRI